MQTLQFETAWERTVSREDRLTITNKFAQLKHETAQGVVLSYLWEAQNHQGNLLITTFIHNYDDKPIRLTDTNIAYIKNEEQITSGTFSIPEAILSQTTMPWTFIFSDENYTDEEPEFFIKHELSF